MIDRDRHFAVVVGLSQYPQLGDPPPSHLEGPENDAEAVYEWLASPGGGGLDAAVDRQDDPKAARADYDPKEQVWRIAKITSSVFPSSPVGAPARDEIQLALRELAQRAEHYRSGATTQLGRRLYIFAAGHGFSPTLNEGCLHAGDADQLSAETNVYFTKWLRLFQEAGYFRETVLWMDCCMNRDRSSASLPTVQVQVSPDPPGPSFVALAARRPLRAVERPTGPGGAARGVFTTVLLEGLRGAAVNPYGMITGRSLADWLRNAQLHRVDGKDAEDTGVSKEPEILREDQDLVFATGMKPLTYPIVVRFPPAAVAEKARLWSGRPPTFRSLDIPASAELMLDLAAGMYVIDVPSRRLRGGLQVTAPATVDINEDDDPVTEPDGLVHVKVEPGEPGAELFLVDEAFNLVARGTSSLELELPFGIYKVRVRSGRRLTEKVHMIDREPDPAAAAEPLPVFSSAAPIPHTAHSHEYQETETWAAQRRTDLVAGSGGQIMLVAREWREQDAESSGFEPWQGVHLVRSSGEAVADLEQDGNLLRDHDAIGSLSVEVDPGLYFLRVREADGRETERSLVVSAGWRTEAYLLRSQRSEDTREARPTRFTVMVRRSGEELSEQDALIDRARVALADERLVLGSELEVLLLSNFDSPIAGIIGGHLLIIEHLRHPGSRIQNLDDIVGKLRGLVGHGHPDVEALSLRCTDRKLVTRGAIAGPPMFLASWRLLVEASYKPGRQKLIPRSLVERVAALAADPPYMSWSVDPDTCQRHRESLTRELERAAHGSSLLEDAATTAAAAAIEPAGDIAATPPATATAGMEGRRIGELWRSDRAAARRLSKRVRELGLPPSAVDML